MSDLVGNPESRLSRAAAHIVHVIYLCRNVIFLSLLEHPSRVKLSVVEDTVNSYLQELTENITAN